MKKYLLTCCLSIFALTAAFSQYSNTGTDFWFGIPENFSSSQIDAQLYIASPVNTTIQVSLANGSYSNFFPVTANVLLNVTIPSFNNPMVTNDQVVENQAIHITSLAPVAVYAANVENATVDASIVYPTPALGNDYRASVYNPSNLFGSTAEVLIVASENNTQVQITPAFATLQGNAAGVPFNVTLQQGQTYLVEANGDLTGTTVKAIGANAATVKFAVFGGNQCASIPNIGNAFICCCDALYEQIPPISMWGTEFAISPLTTRNGDSYYVLANTNGTVVNVSGVGIYNLNAGQFAEFITPGPAKWITSNNPIMVTQYANSQDYDFAPGADPFYIVIPPVNLGTFNTIFGAYAMPLTTDYYLNVVTKTTNINGVVLDGTPIPGASFSPVSGNPAYSFAPLTILQGTHILNSTCTFIATCYGFGQYESYGYLAGANLLSLANPQIVYQADTTGYTSFSDSLNCGSSTLTVFIDSVPGISSVSWNFGDGGSDVAGFSATHTYTNPGTYDIQVVIQTVGACATDTLLIPVTFVGGAVPMNFINDTTICPGDQVTWFISGANGATILWNDNSNDTLHTVGPGTYSVYYDLAGCANYDTATVSTFNLSTGGLPNDMDLCFPDTLTLTASPGAVSYLWQDGSTNQTFDAMAPGTYFVDVTFGNCHAYDTVMLSQKYLNINLLPDTAWFCEGENVEVKVNLNNATYLWSTGNTAQFATFNTVTTASVIASQAGCLALDTIDIKEVICYCNIYVPNSFTPNNDEKNEWFRPVMCNSIDTYTFQIFNRWGQEIFTTSDLTKGWDGKHSGTDAPEGVYTYQITYDSWAVFENEKTVRGQVNLIR